TFLSLLRQGGLLFPFLSFLHTLETNHLAAGLQFANRLFKLFTVVLRLEMQQAYFENVVNTRPEFRQIERFTDEILGACLQSAKFVIWLRSDHKNRQVTARFDFLEAGHDLESVHAGHLEIEKDQIITV